MPLGKCEVIASDYRSEYECVLGWNCDTCTSVSLGTNVHFPEFMHRCMHMCSCTSAGRVYTHLQF